MDVVLRVKNTSKIMKPTKNDVILFDGNQWYVTTKEQLYKEWTELYQNCAEKLATMEQENSDFKNEVGMQLQEMTNLIHKLFEVKGDNL